MAKVDLKLDWCSHEAAKYAVEKWHYSGTMPAGKTVKIGVWENERFIGAVIFSRGANNHIGSPYGLSQTEACELTRVALTRHEAPVSRVVSIAMKMLRKSSRGIRMIISYADPEYNHVGGIYQALGWVYEGVNEGSHVEILCPDGVWRHMRSASSKYTSIDGFASRHVARKHKYLYPLDDAMRAQIAPLAKPYPKRASVV